uniref:Uncharacterized protein n=1 Tax=Rhizophora mucronata TaxID=61149 RepID=A0A2P2R4K8_RHIMU
MPMNYPAEPLKKRKGHLLIFLINQKGAENKKQA